MISHFQGSTEYLDVDRLVTQLLDSNQLRDPKCSVYIQGHGAQHLFYYWFFGHSPDVELVWSGFSGPSFLAFVSLFIPGHAGLVKVKNLDKLTVHYDSLSSNSMSTLHFCRLSSNANSSPKSYESLARGQGLTSSLANQFSSS